MVRSECDGGWEVENSTCSNSGFVCTHTGPVGHQPALRFFSERIERCLPLSSFIWPVIRIWLNDATESTENTVMVIPAITVNEVVTLFISTTRADEYHIMRLMNYCLSVACGMQMAIELLQQYWIYIFFSICTTFCFLTNDYLTRKLAWQYP